jgi:hypothetical protein
MGIGRPTIAVTVMLGCALALAAQTVASASPTRGAPPAASPVSGAAVQGRSLCAPPADTVGPVATRVTFGKQSVDLDSGSRTQRVTVTASDSSGSGVASGVTHVSVAIKGNRFFSSVKLELTSGTPVSGKWAGRFVVSKYSRAGVYSADYLSVTDAAGNEQDYSGDGNVPDGPNALSLHPTDNATFKVTGTPAKQPPRKPAGHLTALSFSMSSVNTTSSSRNVGITATFNGAAPQRVNVGLNTVKKSGHIRFVFLRAILHDHHGTWSGNVKVPRWLGKQDLQPALSVDYGTHFRPTSRYYDPQRLQQLHFPSKLAVVSGVDRTKPHLKSLSLSPHSINSTDGAVRVTVTAKATDTRSGVQFIDVNGDIQHGINGVAAGAYPFASAGVGFTSADDFHVRLKKTAKGAWVGTTTVRKCVPSGTYKLDASLSDFAGNSHYYSTKELAGAHITSTVRVASKHGDVVAPYVYSAATYGADSELFLNFSEGVANVNTSTLTVYPLSPASTRFTTAAAVTALTCANGTHTVDCSGSDGLVTSAVLKVPSLTPGDQYDIYANLNQVTTQLTDGNRNPMDWNYLATEVQDS